MDYSKTFMIGAATAAHQVEGNNIHSDYWTMENLEHSNFSEPSLDAVDHYNRFEEDIRFMSKAGLNAYRFSIEWARIEPEEGVFDDNEIEHYRRVLKCCHENNITPIVTLHHFSSPKWLITKGGWEWEGIREVFPRYCAYVAKELGDLIPYICTINEANMGIQLTAVSMSIMKNLGITPQVGMNFEQMAEAFLSESRKQQMAESAKAFGLAKGEKVHDFLSIRTPEGDAVMMEAHMEARKRIKKVCPSVKVGLTLSLYDLQVREGGEEYAKNEWEEHFGHYIPAIEGDDFIGVQNYTRKLIDKNGDMGAPEGCERTQMEYEFYPEAVANVVRRVSKELPGKEIIVTENGIATADDARRVEYIKIATEGTLRCAEEGIPVIGYMYWTLLDNFEWQKGFSMTFGLIAVDRKTQTRKPKDSLYTLGDIARSVNR